MPMPGTRFMAVLVWSRRTQGSLLRIIGPELSAGISMSLAENAADAIRHVIRGNQALGSVQYEQLEYSDPLPTINVVVALMFAKTRRSDYYSRQLSCLQGSYL
ncbi:hypothetical protein V8C26DRAFT_415646, partial [Trichoderma gracile]